MTCMTYHQSIGHAFFFWELSFGVLSWSRSVVCLYILPRRVSGHWTGYLLYMQVKIFAKCAMLSVSEYIKLYSNHGRVYSSERNAYASSPYNREGQGATCASRENGEPTFSRKDLLHACSSPSCGPNASRAATVG